jgi:hypothetical protein
MPGRPEMVMGAVAEGGNSCFFLSSISQAEAAELAVRVGHTFIGDQLNLFEQTVILSFSSFCS